MNLELNKNRQNTHLSSLIPNLTNIASTGMTKLAPKPKLKSAKLIVIIIFIIAVSNASFAVGAGTAYFSWLPNIESDLGGYKIHYGTNYSGPYDMVVDIGNPSPVDGRVKGSISGLSEGITYYFVATAYNQTGLESNYSSEANYTYGTVLIAGGATSTTTQYVTLTFSPENNVTQMKFSNNNFDWSIAETYSNTKTWLLTDELGVKTVYVQFMDDTGTWSPGYSDTIVLTTPANAPATPTGLQIIAIN